MTEVVGVPVGAMVDVGVPVGAMVDVGVMVGIGCTNWIYWRPPIILDSIIKVVAFIGTIALIPEPFDSWSPVIFCAKLLSLNNLTRLLGNKSS